MGHSVSTDISLAARLLTEGQVVAIPTETVYGLAANALDAAAVARIYEVKNRPKFNPLILHCHSIEQVQSLVTYWPAEAQTLADRFWPGPLTLVLPKAAHVPDLVTAGSTFVAVRIPAHPVALSLLQQLDFPLAAPSANPSNYISPTTAQHVADQLGDKIPLILDGGAATVGVESTILALPEGGSPTLLRHGGLALETIEAAIGPVAWGGKTGDKPASPGQLKVHYSPSKPFLLDPSEDELARWDASQLGGLSFGDSLPNVPKDQQRNLSPTRDLAEAARHVFEYMRELDALPLAAIVAYSLPEEGLGRAINDRLRRAAAKG